VLARYAEWMGCKVLAGGQDYTFEEEPDEMNVVHLPEIDFIGVCVNFPVGQMSEPEIYYEPHMDGCLGEQPLTALRFAWPADDKPTGGYVVGHPNGCLDTRIAYGDVVFSDTCVCARISACHSCGSSGSAIVWGGPRKQAKEYSKRSTKETRPTSGNV
jgi:hypothetical protein